MDEKSSLFFLAYAAFCLLPVMADVKESIVWSKLKSVA